MLDHRQLDDEFDALVSADDETAAETPDPEAVPPPTDRSVAIAEDAYRRERAQHEALEPGEG